MISLPLKELQFQNKKEVGKSIVFNQQGEEAEGPIGYWYLLLSRCCLCEKSKTYECCYSDDPLEVPPHALLSQ